MVSHLFGGDKRTKCVFTKPNWTERDHIVNFDDLNVGTFHVSITTDSSPNATFVKQNKKYIFGRSNMACSLCRQVSPAKLRRICSSLRIANQTELQ